MVRETVNGVSRTFAARGKGKRYQDSQEDMDNPLAVFVEREKEVPVPVQLKSGEIVEVKLGVLKDYIEKHEDVIAFEHDPAMPTRRKLAKQKLQHLVD